MLVQNIGYLRLDRMRQQLPRPRSQDLGQRVSHRCGHPWMFDPNSGIVTSGVFTPVRKG